MAKAKQVTTLAGRQVQPSTRDAYTKVSAAFADALAKHAHSMPGWEYIALLDELMADLKVRHDAMEEELATDA